MIVVHDFSICVNFLLFMLQLLSRSFLSLALTCNLFGNYYQDDEGDSAFHIAAEAAKMIRENLEWIIVMLGYPNAAVELRNHRQEPNSIIAYSSILVYIIKRIKK